MQTPADLEAQALELWEQAQALRLEQSKSNSERLRDFSMLLGIQQSLPDDLQVEGGVSYYADEMLRGMELDKVALLRNAGYIMPDLRDRLADVPPPRTYNNRKVHGFPTIPQEDLPIGMKQCACCGMVWSLAGFLKNPAKRDGVENACRCCIYERRRRSGARRDGVTYNCRNEYAAVRAVFPDETAEDRKAMGLPVHEPKEPKAREQAPLPQTPTPPRKHKPVPHQGPRVVRGGHELKETATGDGVRRYEQSLQS